MRLKERVAIVTGAASGIGRAVATELARRGALAVAMVDMGEAVETVAAEVIRIGRSRVIAASRTAAALECPCSWRWLANSTMRMPFLATRPTSMIRPIWL